MLTVEFVTLGMASKELDVPSATLRHWTDQLEELETHYIMRNDRKERIYYEQDIKIFKYLKDLKSEHGRRTTTKRLAKMIQLKAQEGELELRSLSDIPVVEESEKTVTELLNQDDIARMMQSERVKQFMQHAIAQGIAEGIEVALEKEREVQIEREEERDLETKEQLKRIEDRLESRDKKLMETLRAMQEEKSKSFFQRLFNK